MARRLILDTHALIAHERGAHDLIVAADAVEHARARFHDLPGASVIEPV